MSAKAKAKQLAAIGARPVAVNECVSQRKSDYAAKKRKAERDNHKAKLAGAAVLVHAGVTLSPRVLAMLEAARVPAPVNTKAEIGRVAMGVRSMLTTLLVDLGKYGEADERDLQEVLVHLDRSRSALLDLPRAARERRMASLMVGG